jgi:PIN domain nuclease of toxin-antitoxin system
LRILLDSDAFIFMTSEPRSLSQRARSALADPGNTLLLSPLTTMELAVKASKGKLSFSSSAGAFVSEQAAALGLEPLPITHEHAARSEFLPWIHRDPFDRLFAAVALAEALPIVSSDELFDGYGVTRIW